MLRYHTMAEKMVHDYGIVFFIQVSSEIFSYN